MRSASGCILKVWQVDSLTDYICAWQENEEEDGVVLYREGEKVGGRQESLVVATFKCPLDPRVVKCRLLDI